MSLADVIERHSTALTVTRSGGTSQFVKGERQELDTTTEPIRGCVQPLSGEDVANLPNGLSADETKALYTTAQLSSGSKNVEPDYVEYRGTLYKVAGGDDWQELAGYFRYLITLV